MRTEHYLIREPDIPRKDCAATRTTFCPLGVYVHMRVARDDEVVPGRFDRRHFRR